MAITTLVKPISFIKLLPLDSSQLELESSPALDGDAVLQTGMNEHFEWQTAKFHYYRIYKLITIV